MVERVGGGKSFSLGGAVQSVIAADKGKRMGNQTVMRTQRCRQLDGVVSLEGVTLGRRRGCLQIGGRQWDDGIAMNKLSNKMRMGSVALRSPDSAYTLDHGEPRRDLHARDFRDKNDMTKMTGFCGSLVDQLTNPRAAWFGDVVCDQCAGVKVIERPAELATVVCENLT